MSDESTDMAGVLGDCIKKKTQKGGRRKLSAACCQRQKVSRRSFAVGQ